MTGRTAHWLADDRRHALDLAVELYAGTGQGASPAITAADLFLGWLTAQPVRLILNRPVLTFSQGSPGPGIPTVIFAAKEASCPFP